MGGKKDESKDFRVFLKDILFHHQNGPRAHTRLYMYMEIHQICNFIGLLAPITQHGRNLMAMCVLPPKQRGQNLE